VPGIVRITDVSPRDGLQNEPGVIASSDKARLIEALFDASPDEIEVSSFVSRRWVPQLGDAGEVFAMIAPRKPRETCLSALVPNAQGFESALAVNQRAGSRVIDKVSVFTAASEAFSKRNTNATIAESLERFAPVIASAHREGFLVRGYISCVIACPFEGAIAPARVADVASRLASLGVDEIDLGDTIGAAARESVNAMLIAVLDTLGAPWLDARTPSPADASSKPYPRLVLHLHDTFARAAECVREALSIGVRSFDGSVAGLGGCPYASTPDRRAPGNIDTSLLVRTIEGAGYTTGVNASKLAAAATIARDIVGRARLFPEPSR
jgi:hydroxymethylglutaryl-CoA lyase